MDSETYNGHKNYQTWNVSLWINNDPWLHLVAKEVSDYKEFTDRMIDAGLTQTKDEVSWSDEDLDYNSLDELIASIN